MQKIVLLEVGTEMANAEVEQYIRQALRRMEEDHNRRLDVAQVHVQEVQGEKKR